MEILYFGSCTQRMPTPLDPNFGPCISYRSKPRVFAYKTYFSDGLIDHAPYFALVYLFWLIMFVNVSGLSVSNCVLVAEIVKRLIIFHLLKLSFHLLLYLWGRFRDGVLYASARSLPDLPDILYDYLLCIVRCVWPPIDVVIILYKSTQDLRTFLRFVISRSFFSQSLSVLSSVSDIYYIIDSCLGCV